MRVVRLILVAAVSFACPRLASAATADGTLITNVASFTLRLTSGVGLTVSYNATVVAVVQNPCLTGLKRVSPSVMNSGGVMTYTIWVVNCSCLGSAFNINVTDRLPGNVVMGSNIAPWNGGSGGNWYPSSGSNNTTWAPGAPLTGQAPPYFLRYVLDQLGPCKSAYASFTVSVL